jgi:hypothetical protein
VHAFLLERITSYNFENKTLEARAKEQVQQTQEKEKEEKAAKERLKAEEEEQKKEEEAKKKQNELEKQEKVSISCFACTRFTANYKLELENKTFRRGSRSKCSRKKKRRSRRRKLQRRG